MKFLFFHENTVFYRFYSNSGLRDFNNVENTTERIIVIVVL